MIDELTRQLDPAAREHIALWHRPRAIGPFRRADRLVLAGECWRLGAILLSVDGRVWATGTVIRTEEERISGHTSELSRSRAELRAAARRGRIPAGLTFNVDPDELFLNSPTHPLRQGHSGIEVQWSPGLWRPLENYLFEQANMLLDSRS